MRIVHVCHDYWPAVGGSELLLKEVSERLVGWGEEVRVFTSNAPCSEAFVNPALPLLSPGEETIGGVPVTRFPISRRFRRPLNLVMQGAWRLRLPFNDLVRTFWNGPTCPRMIREIIRAKPDLVVATAFPFQTMYYPFMARLFRPFPIVLIPCFHQSDPWSFDRPIMERVLKAADAVIVLTDFERDQLLSMGVQGEKLHVIGVGTDPEYFRDVDCSAFRTKHGIGNTDPVIAFVGRMEPGKGVDTLLDAMPRVWRVNPTARLVLAGPSTYYSSAVNVKIAAFSGENREKVLALGVVSETEKRELLGACDLLALPSRVESFGIVYLEAWACGKPVIGCRTGAVSSVITDGEDGLLVTYGDPDELAAAIIRLASDEAIRQRLGEKGRAKVLDRYNWDRIAKETRGLYRHLIDERTQAVRSPRQIWDRAIPGETHDQRAGGNPLVSVVIVCTNDRQHLAECLGSIQNGTSPDVEMIVADNGSSDGSVEFIRRTFPSVKVIELGKNLGFPEANNRAFRVARGKYVFQLNPDTRIDARCIEELVVAMEADETIGVAAAKMKIYFEPDVLNSAGIVANQILYAYDRGAFELDRGQYDTPAEVIAGCGGALMVRRTLIERIGGLDARFFMYYEDLDFGIRTWLSGARVLFIPQAVVYHKYKAGIRKAIYNEYYDHRNRVRTMIKNFSLSSLAWMLPASLKFNAKVILRYFAAGRSRNAVYQLRALLWNLAALPSALRERKRIQRLRTVPDAHVLRLLAAGKGYPELSAAAPSPEVAYRHTISSERLESFVKMGENDHRQLGLGWHPRERWGDRAVRWTSGYGIAFLKRPTASSKEIEVECECYASSRTSGSFLVNDQPAGEYRILPGMWTNIRFRFKSETELLQLTILPLNTVVPQERTGCGDHREIGLAVSSIRLVGADEGNVEATPDMSDEQRIVEQIWEADSGVDGPRAPNVGLLESNHEYWERSRIRWRRAEPNAGLTWARELSGDRFVLKVASLGAFDRQKSILELGPGYGRLLKACLDRKLPFKEWVGVDISRRNISHLQENFQSPHVCFVEADFEVVALDNTFDVVLSSLTFKHLFPSFEKALANIAKYINPGGLFFYDLIEGKQRYFERDGLTYIRHYERKEVLDILGRAGLKWLSFDEVLHDRSCARLLVVATKPE